MISCIEIIDIKLTSIIIIAFYRFYYAMHTTILNNIIEDGNERALIKEEIDDWVLFISIY